MSSRPETGPIQFGNDWPGVFIRGDNALGYQLALDAILNHEGTVMDQFLLKQLSRLLGSCDATKQELVDQLKDYKECK